MQPTIVTLAFLATSAMSIALPQDVDDNDIPSQCTAVCQSVVALTQQCDRDINNDNSDVLYRNCICTAEGASTVIPICEACVRQYRPTTTTTDDDGEVDQDTNDVDDVVRACNFSTTTYDASQTSSLSIGSGVTTATAIATTGSTGGGSGTVTNAVGTGTSNAESGASSLSSGVATAASQGSGAMPTAGVGAGIAAIVGVAALI